MRFIKELYLTNRFFQVMALLVLFYLAGYFYPFLEGVADLLLLTAGLLFIADYFILFKQETPINATRTLPRRLSNGDENKIWLQVKGIYPVPVELEIIDELPEEFQIRDFSLQLSLQPHATESLTYSLRPTHRGEYTFGNIICFAESIIGLVRRKISVEATEHVPVYPSYVQMRKFEMYAISNRLSDIGVKKIRRVGHTMEFDQIKEYVRGDDVRSINWKATARANELMVNQYQDERSQSIVNVIDMGRVMKMPFDGMHLLDYAINTSLVISNIALTKEDKAGLVAFSNDNAVVVKPEKKRSHIQRIQEALYNLSPNFLESDFERLVVTLRKQIKQRSLILLYTNFQNLSAMKRQLPYLQQIARDHLLVTVFFENTELTQLLESTPENVQQIYTKAIAEKFDFEKRQIVKDLKQRGIQTILTPPKELSVNTINKYLELKSRGIL